MIDSIELVQNDTTDSKGISTQNSARNSEGCLQSEEPTAPTGGLKHMMTSINAFSRTRLVVLVIFTVVISLLSSFFNAIESYMTYFILFELTSLLLTSGFVFNKVPVSDRTSTELPSSLGLILQTIRYLKPSLAVPAEAILLIAWTFARMLSDLCVFLFTVFVCTAVISLF